jgi:hypothetical protein
MLSQELKARARHYLQVRRAQELDHTNPALNEARTEAHDALMLQMDMEGIFYTDRENAAYIARQIVAGEWEETIPTPVPVAQGTDFPSPIQKSLFEL